MSYVYVPFEYVSYDDGREVTETYEWDEDLYPYTLDVEFDCD